MASSRDDRKEILQKLASGEIDAAEASRLLSDLSLKEEPVPKESYPSVNQTLKISKEDIIDSDRPRVKQAGPSWFHIRVDDLKTGKNRVTVNIPVNLLSMGFNIGRRFAPELADLDWQEIGSTISARNGVLIDVTDEADGEHVQIYVD